MDTVLVCGLAAAFVVAGLRELPTPGWLDHASAIAVVVSGVWALDGSFLPYQCLAAMFVAAFLSTLARSMSRGVIATRRDLRNRVPPL